MRSLWYCWLIAQSSFISTSAWKSVSSPSLVTMSRNFSKRSATASGPSGSLPTIKKPKFDISSDDEEKNSSNGNNAHVRDIVVPQSLSGHTSSLKIISWNVNGLKALVSTKKEILDRLILTHQPDILCLQETKIQENVVDSYRNLLDGYHSYWSCSTVKKGYSGTVCTPIIIRIVGIVVELIVVQSSLFGV
jgi:hypothetical protein